MEVVMAAATEAMEAWEAACMAWAACTAVGCTAWEEWAACTAWEE